MSLSKITILSFNNWLDGKLFDGLILPDGIDKDLLINNILLEGADFEVLYSNPYFMQEAIEVWAKKYYRTFEKWITALNIEYNPLDNYCRNEEWHDVGNSKSTSNSNSSQSGTINTSQNDTTNNNTSAYDSNEYQPNEQSISNGNSTSTSYGTNTNASNDSNDTKNDRTGRAWGNIGTLTSQKMLSDELDIAKWNIYKHITDLFLQEFTIMIYV